MCRASSPVCGVPPAAGTRTRGVVESGEKRITPSRFQAPLRPFAASQIGSGGAPDTSTFWSLPSAKNARKRLSGDQNGNLAPWVPAIGLAPSSPSDRSQRIGLPSASLPANVAYRPSGEIVRDPQLGPVKSNSDFSAGRTKALNF